MGVAEHLRHGNLIGDIKFGHKWPENQTSSRLVRDTLKTAVFQGADTLAFLSVSTLKTEFWDRNEVQPNSPIRVELTQFKTVQVVNEKGELEEHVQTWEDVYLLGIKHPGEDYGGELWLHTTSMSESSEVGQSDEVGDLAFYRDIVEEMMDEVQCGSNQWQRFDDILSFIDKRNKGRQG